MHRIGSRRGNTLTKCVIMNNATDPVVSGVADVPTLGNEPNIMPEMAYNMELILSVSTTETVEGSKKLLDMVSNEIVGCGMVDLVEFQLKYQMNASGQTVKACFVAADRTVTSTQISGMPNSYAMTSSSYNYGPLVTVVMTPPAPLSRQIQPVSSLALPPKIVFKVSKGVDLHFVIKMKHHGPRVLYREIKASDF